MLGSAERRQRLRSCDRSGVVFVYKSGFLLGSSYQLNSAQRTANNRVSRQAIQLALAKSPTKMAFFKVSV